MPTFDTPGPIAVTVEVAGAQVRVTASDRTDTVVLVEPINEANRSDVKVANKTKVDFAGGQLSVRTTAPGGKNGSVAITIDLPAGSSLVAYLAHSGVHADGSFGECELHMASGRVQLDRINALQANISAGEVEIGHIAGRASIENRAGHIWIGHASADLELSSGSGSLDIDRADGSVTATTADSPIRIGRLTRGQAELTNGSETSRSASARAPLPGWTPPASGGRYATPFRRRRTPARSATRSRSTPARDTETSSFNAQQADPHEASVTSTS